MGGCCKGLRRSSIEKALQHSSAKVQLILNLHDAYLCEQHNETICRDVDRQYEIGDIAAQ